MSREEISLFCWEEGWLIEYLRSGLVNELDSNCSIKKVQLIDALISLGFI